MAQLTVLAGLPPTGGRFLEVGTAAGVTAAVLADRRPDVEFVCVDDFRPASRADEAETDADREARWRRNQRPNMKLFRGTAAAFGAGCPPASFDVVLVDANHRHPDVDDDLQMAARVLRPAGYLVAHDYGDANWPDVTEAADAFMAGCGWYAVRRQTCMLIMGRA